MGGSQSAPEAANPLTNGQDVFPLSGELDEQKRVNDENQFGVKIVFEDDGKEVNSSILSLDEELEKAYQRGFQDANLQVDQKINMLATEVYESVQNHLNRFQDQHLEKSNQEIKKLKQQLSTVQPLTSACDQQKNDLLQCLKGNPTTPLSCRIMVNSLTKCASESLRREQIS